MARVPPASWWRSIPAATPTLRESTADETEITTNSSQTARHWSLKPCPSLPSTRARGRRGSKDSRGIASGLRSVPTSRIPRLLRNFTVRAVSSASASDAEKQLAIEARIPLREKGSPQRAPSNTASVPKAAALRRIPPKLTGSVTPSRIRKSPASVGLSSSTGVRAGRLNTPMQPRWKGYPAIAAISGWESVVRGKGPGAAAVSRDTIPGTDTMLNALSPAASILSTVKRPSPTQMPSCLRFRSFRLATSARSIVPPGGEPLHLTLLIDSTTLSSAFGRFRRPSVNLL